MDTREVVIYWDHIRSVNAPCPPPRYNTHSNYTHVQRYKMTINATTAKPSDSLQTLMNTTFIRQIGRKTKIKSNQCGLFMCDQNLTKSQFIVLHTLKWK